MRSLLTLVATIALSITLAAVAAPTDRKISVTVYVNCSNEQVRQRAQSYLERELRDLHDVEISSDVFTSDYALRIIANNILVGGQNVWAFAYSYTFYEDCGTERVVVLGDGGLGFALTFEQLKSLAATIVANMDQKALKAYREAHFNSHVPE